MRAFAPGRKVLSIQNMNELQHDRALDRIATQTLALDAVKLNSAGAVAIIRVWINREGDPPMEFFSQELNVAACLTADLVATSGGDVVYSRGQILVATFSGTPAGVLTARRLQWAFQGLLEIDRFAGLASAVLVKASGDLQREGVLDALFLVEQAAPGKILLDEKACLVLDDLPGLETEPTARSDIRALLWRRPEAESASIADEQTSFRQLIEQGRGVPLKEPAADAKGDSHGTAALGHSSQNRADGDTAHSRWNSKWLIWGASAAALLCAAGLAAIAFHRQTPATPPTPVPQMTVVTPGPSPAPPASSPTPATQQQKPEAPIPNPPGPDASKAHPKGQTEDTSGEKQSTVACDLSSAGIPRMLARAENSLHGGKLDDAQRDFQSVLACDRSNAKAQEGLRLVRERRQGPK